MEASVCVARPRAPADCDLLSLPGLRFRHPRRRLSEACRRLGRGVGSLSLTLVLRIGVAIGRGHEHRDYPGLLSATSKSRSGTGGDPPTRRIGAPYVSLSHAQGGRSEAAVSRTREASNRVRVSGVWAAGHATQTSNSPGVGKGAQKSR
jgi:hypothetical protein